MNVHATTDLLACGYRTRRPADLLLAALLLLLATTGQALAQPGNADKIGKVAEPLFPHDPDHVLVKLREGAAPLDSLAPGFELVFGRWYKVPVDSTETAEDAMFRKSLEADVEIVELNYVLAMDSLHLDAPAPASEKVIPNDPGFAKQWNLALVQAPAAWEIANGVGVLVAVIDSGVSRGADLACRNFVDEYNALTGQAGPGTAADDFGHGTHVAGTIAQCTGNGEGVAGIAHGADLMPIKVFMDPDGPMGPAKPIGGGADVIARGIVWAVLHGARVINMSLGVSCGTQLWPACSSALLNEAIEVAELADVVIVAAAGNNSQAVVGIPANHPAVIAVGAVGPLATKTGYSNFGSALELVAPGGDLAVDFDRDGLFDGVVQETLIGLQVPSLCPSASSGPFAYCALEGTSMASPHVAGAAALLRSHRPEANRRQVQAALQWSAFDLGQPGIDPLYGTGLLQIADALADLDFFLDNVPQPCLPGDNTLCLADRFEVTMIWETPAGQVGQGRAIPLTTDSGYFWFFSPANVEVVIKIINGCGSNGFYWVFASGLTNVQAELVVRDTLTGAEKRYFNPFGTFRTILDNKALATCG